MAKEGLLKKIEKLLSKVGLDDSKVEKLTDEIEGLLSEESNPEEGNPEDPTPEDKGGEPAPEEEGAPVPPTDEVPVPPAEPQPEPSPEGEPAPADGSIEQVLAQAAALDPAASGEPAPAQEPAPVEQPPVPEFDAASKFAELENELAEQKKANEGLIARIDSLEDALRKSGVIEGTANVGDENPKLSPSASDDGGNTLNDVLNEINGRNR